MKNKIACILILTSLAGAVHGLASIGSSRARAQTPQPLSNQDDTLALRDRVVIASKIYRIVSSVFPRLSQAEFDKQYTEYVSRILLTNERREFDLASMEFIAGLHDGHTWFYDDWLDRKYGQPVGFTAYPVDSKWVVVQSTREDLGVGDVIAAVDDQPMEAFYGALRRYVSASSARDSGASFFATPAIFPERFTLTIEGGGQVVIDREHDKRREEPPPKTEARWITPGKIAYFKVPTFHGIDTQAQAIQSLREFRDAKALILDVRGNPGGGDPTALQRALITQPFSTWKISSAMKGGVLLRNYDAAYPERSEITTSDAVISPRDPIFGGKLFLLTDRACSCACEDFVMPFKMTKRAVLVGETTAGTFSFTNFTEFENGMLLNVASIRHSFPDGSQFEGIGIKSDVDIHATPSDLKQGHDVVLRKAIDLASQQ